MSTPSVTRRSISLAALMTLVMLLVVAPARRAAAADAYQILTGELELAVGGHYVLKSSQEQGPLKDAGGMDKHLGRVVRITGQWQDSADGRRLRVAKIEYVAALPVDVAASEVPATDILRASVPIVGTQVRPQSEVSGPDQGKALEPTGAPTVSSGGGAVGEV